MVHAAVQLGSKRVNSTIGLTAVNPHVSSIFVELRAMGQTGPHILRQNAGCLASNKHTATQAHGLTAVSSFAFQGTNAHVLLSRLDAAILRSDGGDAQVVAWPCSSAAVWHHRRLWYSEPAYALVQQCAVSSAAQVLVMSCQLSAPALAYLADHQVRPAYANGHGKSWTPLHGLAWPPLHVGPTTVRTKDPERTARCSAGARPCALPCNSNA